MIRSTTKCLFSSCIGGVWCRTFAKTVMASQLHSGEGNPCVSQLRNKYLDPCKAFTEEQLVSKDPIKQFEAWFDAALNHEKVDEANAMTLSTVSASGKPSARVVLLKGFGPDGFKFFTNSLSRKGKELAVNPNVALVFYWTALHRSVRIEGVASKLSEDESKTYFATRPRPSQIAAHVSTTQSAPVESREKLVEIEKGLMKNYEGFNVPKPEYWGGYLVRPEVIEFWQGQSSRMHDRFRFRKKGHGDPVSNDAFSKEGENGWLYQRLMP